MPLACNPRFFCSTPRFFCRTPRFFCSTPRFLFKGVVYIQSSTACFPACRCRSLDFLHICKNELARPCKKKESCMQDLHGTCTRYVPFLARFLHNLAHILQDLAKNVQETPNLQVIILAAISCKICASSCKICARLC